MPRDMAMMYGAPPPMPTLPEGWQPTVPEDLLDELRKTAERATTLKVDPPPPYAADPEQAAIAAVVLLDDEARGRVLRYLVSRFGVPNP